MKKKTTAPVRSTSSRTSMFPESMTKVTPFSKALAMVLFVTLPFVGFILGMIYQQSLMGVGL
ncbi:MAG TPA: hypothetical protein VD999_05010 [Vitreimonas sp.]|nr:hypothetical protein [Vitreimonas sp.]